MSRTFSTKPWAPILGVRVSLPSAIHCWLAMPWSAAAARRIRASDLARLALRTRISRGAARAAGPSRTPARLYRDLGVSRYRAGSAG
jgi:hypothetical protein